MSNFYTKIQDILSNTKHLSFRVEYYRLGDSLTVTGYSTDDVPRVKVTLQNSEIPEFDVSFGDDIHYYSSLGSQESAIEYLERLLGDLYLLDALKWKVTLASLVLTKRKYITIEEGNLTALKSPPRFLLRKSQEQELHI